LPACAEASANSHSGGRAPGDFWRLGRFANMIQNFPHVTRFVDEGDNPHLGVTDRTGQGERFVDARQQHRPQIVRHGAARFSSVPAASLSDKDGTITTTGASAITAARSGELGARTP